MENFFLRFLSFSFIVRHALHRIGKTRCKHTGIPSNFPFASKKLSQPIDFCHCRMSILRNWRNGIFLYTNSNTDTHTTYTETETQAPQRQVTDEMYCKKWWQPETSSKSKKTNTVWRPCFLFCDIVVIFQCFVFYISFLFGNKSLDGTRTI